MTNTPTRCAYFHIEAIQYDYLRLDIPMEFRLLIDDEPVRTFYRLYGRFATERVLLDSNEHIATLLAPDGTAVRHLRIPAGEHSWMIPLSESEDFAPKGARPAAQVPHNPDADRLADLLLGKLKRTLNPTSPFCHLYKSLEVRDLDHLWFEFWETAMLIRFMPKSGHVPDLKKDFDEIQRYDKVKDIRELSFADTLHVERRIADALTEAGWEGITFYRNDQNQLCAKRA